METVQLILFDRQEREILATANLSATVLYQDDPDTLRLLRGVAQANDEITPKRLMAAATAYEELARVLREQADPDYWTGRIPDVPGEDRVPEAMRAARKREVLMEARTRQAEQAELACRLIRVAIATADPERDAQAREAVLA